MDQFKVAFKSQTSYYSLLKEAKISWRKAQPKNPLQDPQLVKTKNQNIQDIITGLLPEIKAKNVVIYTIDEVHLLEEDLTSHLWGKTDKRLK
ncbi:winged helix-turn-helix domain-containing protein, partial [Microcystis sp. M144S2]|uniref:winged helix-turn-helix domain-containing protein n=1 Tax=Microcystis sp. M144S2 TaxID=2771147 RepID=UPI002590D4DC